MSETPLMTKKIRHGLRAVLVVDEHSYNPRGDDNITRIVTWHRKYLIGDEGPGETPTKFIANLLCEYHPEIAGMDERDLKETSPKALLEKYPYPGYLQPLYIYDHGGYVLSMQPFSCPWDSGWLGFIYITPKMAKEYRVEIEERATDIMIAELKMAEAWGNGYVYAVRIEDDYETIECFGSIYNMRPERGSNNDPDSTIYLPAPGYPGQQEMDEAIQDSSQLSEEDIELAMKAEWKEER